MKQWKNYQLIMFVSVCLIINLFGKKIAEAGQLPLWLDSIGTVLAAYVIGPFAGAVTGLGVNLMYGAFSANSYAYALTNIAVGITAGMCAKKGMFKKPFLVFSMSMLLAIVAVAFSLPINYFLQDGMTGNLWGDGVIGYLDEIGAVKGISRFLGEFYVDLLDKLVSAFLVYIIIIIYRKRNKINPDKIAAAVIAVIIMAAAFVSPVKAEEKTVVSSYYDSYIQTIYNSSNGIPGGVVNDIAQTRDGMLWFGTYGGLYQYDGNKFTFMSGFKTVRNVNCLYTDEEGRLWIGTNDSGLSICANNQIVNVIDKTGGLSEDSVRSIVKSSDGYYYAGTNGGLCVIALTDGIKVKKVFDELNYVRSLDAAEDGYVCAVTLNGELALIHNTEIVKIYKNNAEGDTYDTVCFDDNGYLYAATSAGQIEKYIIVNNELQQKNTYSCGKLNKINSICMTEDKILMVCADNGIGYIEYDGRFNMINTNNFDSSIDEMLVDYQGNIWFSSSRLGLLKLSASISEEIYSKAGINQDVVNAICKWNGRFYFGTDSGLDIVDEGIGNVISNELTEFFDGVRIRCIITDTQDHMWIATMGQGVYEVISDDNRKKYDTSNGLIDNNTRSVLELEDGTIAVSTNKGISYIKNGQIVCETGAYEGLTTPKILCLFEKNGILYAGSDGGGVALISENKVVKMLRKSDGLSSDVILRIGEAGDGSGLYIITSNGLNFYDNEGKIRQLDQFPYYNNYDILHGKDGRIWVTGSAGIYIVNEDALLSDKAVDYELLDAKRGLRDSFTANSWNYVDKNNNLYLCCDKGVVLIDMEKYDSQRSSYRIMLESILVDGVPVSIDKEEVNKLSRDVVKVELFPKVINYSPSNPYVSVWLEGFDKEPRIMLQSELESLVYTNLPSGNYTFHLAIMDNKQQNIVEHISYSFLKEKEIYDNWWFVLYILLIMAIVLIYFVWLVIGSQIDKSMKIQKKEFENLKLKQQADAALAAGEAKNRFLALMSHDIRTPINTILGMNEMIRRESNEDIICDYSDDIKSAGSTLLALVNMILDYSKIEEGKMEIIPVNYETRELIKNLVNGVSAKAKDKGLDFIIDIDENIPAELYGDDVRINQVISNLLTNAVKYTEKGFFTLTIKVQEKHDDSIMLYVEVKDSGIGIHEEDMDKLFESFKRLDEERNRKIEGTGLGMSIVNNLLNMMDSRLDVESTYGKGSCFSFVIEQKIVNPEPVGSIESSHKNLHSENGNEEHLCAPNARILVVDDNEMNIKVACCLLKANQIKPDTALSGEIAIEKVKKKQYDIIFIDYMMPEMDGLQTLNYMKENNLISEPTKVIVLTANAINGAKEYYIKEGFDDYLSKPIEVDVLESKLKKYLTDNRILSETAATKEDELSDYGYLLPKDKLIQMCPEIDVDTGLKYCMDSIEFLNEIIEEYIIGDKTNQLNSFFEQKDWHNYRILIHSVKSNSMSIGAVTISEYAKKLEFAARDEDIEFIVKEHDSFVKDYGNLIGQLKEYLGNHIHGEIK